MISILNSVVNESGDVILSSDASKSYATILQSCNNNHPGGVPLCCFSTPKRVYCQLFTNF